MPIPLKRIALLTTACLLAATSFSAAPAGKGKAKGRKKPAMVSDRITAHVAVGRERYVVKADLAGYFPVVVVTNRGTVRISLNVPGLTRSEDVRATVITEGELFASRGFGGLVGKPKGQVLTGSYDGRGGLGFAYRFGDSKHNQRIHVKAGHSNAIFNLHYHDPADAHGHGEEETRNPRSRNPRGGNRGR